MVLHQGRGGYNQLDAQVVPQRFLDHFDALDQECLLFFPLFGLRKSMQMLDSCIVFAGDGIMGIGL